MKQLKKLILTFIHSLPFVIILFLIGYAIIHYMVPAAKIVQQKNVSILKLYRNSAGLPRLKNDEVRISKEIARLDSIISVSTAKQPIESALFINKLYQIADSAKLFTDKLEVSEKNQLEQRSELQVIFRGKGPYSGLGLFCQAIENEDIAVRIRQISAKRIGENSGEYTVDFVIMEENQL
jgi:hypothetical protein